MILNAYSLKVSIPVIKIFDPSINNQPAAGYKMDCHHFLGNG